MLIHPFDRSHGPEEWRSWLDSRDGFGTLAVPSLDAGRAPLLLPTHFTLAGEDLLLHLAHANPVWPHLEAAAEVRLAIIADYAYVPSYWRSEAARSPEAHGVPTSYYSSVQFVCRPQVIDDPAAKAELLAAQLADLQPEGRHGPVVHDREPYGHLLPAIRGVRLTVLSVDAKFKYDDHKAPEQRRRIAGLLEQRAGQHDLGAAMQQRRRLAGSTDLEP